MSKDDDGEYEDDAYTEEFDPTVFEDFVSQRAIAFVYLARFAEGAKDQTAKELTFTMMRKLSMSIRTPSTADLKVVD
jgi:hypothetical protein